MEKIFSVRITFKPFNMTDNSSLFLFSINLTQLLKGEYRDYFLSESNKNNMVNLIQIMLEKNLKHHKPDLLLHALVHIGSNLTVRVV